MDKDRHESSWKKRKAPLRLVDPRCEAKALRTGTKGVAATAAMPPPTAPVVTAGGMPSPGKASQDGVVRSAEMGGAVAMVRQLFVDDYLLEGLSVFDAHTGLVADGNYFLLV